MSSMSSVAGLSKYITTLPNMKFSVKATITITFILGLLISIIRPYPTNILLGIIIGGIISFIIYGLSGIISGFINQNLISSFNGINLKIKHSMFLSFINSTILSVITLIGSIISSNPNFVINFIEFGYILIFAFSFLVFWGATQVNMKKSSLVALIQPVISIFLLLAVNFIGLNVYSVSFSIYLVVKMLIGCLIFLIAIYLFVKTINSPMKTNMSIDGLQLLSLFITHMNEGSHDLEELFVKSGADIDTVVSIVSFKTKEKIKALFISPAVHPGPLGNIGGGNMPTNLANRFKPFTMIAHGPSTHDFNPASIKELDKIEDSIRKGLYKMEYSKNASKFVRYTNKSAKIGVQSFNDGIVLLNTFAPLGSDDIEFSVGLTMMVQANKTFENKSTVIVDCHNSFSEESGQVLPGDPQVFELIDGISKIKLGEKYSDIKVGCSQNLMEGLGKEEGVGDSGVKTMVIDVEGQKTAYILFDSNNMEVGFRQEILDFVYKCGIDEAEVMTTDTHSVNTISRGYNPIGLSNRAQIIDYVKETIEEALEDLEEVEVGCSTEKIENLKTFGPNRSTELISTISSIVQVGKIIGPVIFVFAFILTFIWLFLL